MRFRSIGSNWEYRCGNLIWNTTYVRKGSLPQLVIDHLHLECDKLDLTEWNSIVERIKALNDKVTIALVGKYIELKDAYLSVAESLKHGGIFNDVDVEIKWVHAEDVEDENAKDIFADVDGI